MSKKTRAAARGMRAAEAGAMPVRMQSARRIFARGAAGTRRYAAAGAAADRERRRAATQGHRTARGLGPAINRGTIFFRTLAATLRHETAAGGSPRLCTRPAKPQARGPGIKRVWNVRADGNRQRFPTPGVGIAGGIVCSPHHGKLPEQKGQLVCGERGTRRRRRCKSALHRGRETGLTKGEWKCHT